MELKGNSLRHLTGFMQGESAEKRAQSLSDKSSTWA